MNLTHTLGFKVRDGLIFLAPSLTHRSQALCAVIIAVFFVFRVILGPYILCIMLLSKDVVLAQNGDVFSFWFQVVVMAGFVVLNSVWFVKLWNLLVASPKVIKAAANDHKD
jgi:hypothetical protein